MGLQVGERAVCVASDFGLWEEGSDGSGDRECPQRGSVKPPPCPLQNRRPDVNPQNLWLLPRVEQETPQKGNVTELRREAPFLHN